MDRRCRGAVLALLGLACSGTTTIYRPNGPAVVGRVVGSDAGALYVRGHSGDYRIERSTITEIDNPGNVHLVVGTVLAAVAAGMLVGAVATRDRRDNDGLAILAGVYGVPALLLMRWGIFNYLPARSASACFRNPGEDRVCDERRP